ncbi:peptidase M24 [Bryobacterales bacterium F-183]|nr:peptidase M24 [Bryobacterales bacterium F-183]
MMNLSAIQDAIRQEGVDGWLFFDHHVRDPLAYRVLGLPLNMHVTRRWYYFIPAQGEPGKMVHRIEAGHLDSLPGSKFVYSSWDTQRDGLQKLLSGSRRIAMQYSPLCAIPYVAMVDAGTIELVRVAGVEEIHSSADLIQMFEARWTAEQYEMHVQAGTLVDRIRREAFEWIGTRHRAQSTVTEFGVQQFIMERFSEASLETDHPPIVAVNANASDPHYAPSAEAQVEIRPGDSVLIDLWAKLIKPQAVFYDITWMGYCGVTPPDRLVNVFAVGMEARDAAVTLVAKAAEEGRGLQGFEVDDACRGVIKAHGYGEYFVHRTGHSIGTDVHGSGANMDNLETHDVRRIIPGTCFSVEPGIYLAEFGVRTEVNVYVGEHRAGVTGEVQRKLVEVV